MSNPKERACMRSIGPDCKHLMWAHNYWCINKECCQERGTTIPGLVLCPYYEPKLKVLDHTCAKIDMSLDYLFGAVCGAVCGAACATMFALILYTLLMALR